MKKNLIRMGIAAGILLVVYHLLVFLIPFVKNTVFWLSYEFTLVAMFIAACALYIAFPAGGSIKSKFYGFPIAKLGVTYFTVQLVLGFVGMWLSSWLPWWLVLIIYTLAMGAGVLALIGADAVRDEIQEQDVRLEKAVSAMRIIQSKVNQLPAQCEEAQAAAALQTFAEEVRYSDPVSSPALQEIETDLTAVVNDLQQAVLENDTSAVIQLCKKATAILMERNRLCKLNK